MLAMLDINGGTTLLNSVAPTGDYDADGDVDENDYTVWRTKYQAATILYGSGADGTFDGAVDASDYVIWRKQAGSGAGSGMWTAAHAVPEPASTALAFIALGTFACCSVSRSRRSCR
jgi:hypothetical protein